MNNWDILTLRAVEAAAFSTSETHVVGAAIQASDGSIHVGANLEANNHRSTIHGEDAAISSMLMSNQSLTVQRLVTIAADYSDGKLGDFYYTYPCGSCRNILYMFSAYGTEHETEVWWDDYPCQAFRDLPDWQGFSTSQTT